MSGQDKVLNKHLSGLPLEEQIKLCKELAKKLSIEGILWKWAAQALGAILALDIMWRI